MTLLKQALITHFHKEYQRAESLIRESLAIFRKTDNKYGIRHVLSMGYIFTDQGRYEEAEQWFREVLPLNRESGDQDGEAWTLNLLGDLAATQADYTKALPFLEQSIAIYRELRDFQWGLASPLILAGAIMLNQHDYKQAQNLLKESLTLWQKLDNRRAIVLARVLLGRAVLYQQNNYRYALELFQENLRPSQEAGENLILIRSLEGVAEVELALGSMERAAKLCGASEFLEELLKPTTFFQTPALLASTLTSLRRVVAKSER